MNIADMVVVNGVRYRPEDAPKGVKSDAEIAVEDARRAAEAAEREAAAAAAKKAAPAAKNKARQPEQSGDAGAAGTVATKA